MLAAPMRVTTVRFVSNPCWRRRSVVGTPLLIVLVSCNALFGIDTPNDKPSDANLHDGGAGSGSGDATPDATSDEAATGGERGGDGADAPIDRGMGGSSGGDATDGPADVNGDEREGDGGTALGTITRVSVSTDGTQGNQNTYEVSVSGDGNLVAFSSDATNLVFFDTNGQTDIFLYDRSRLETTRVSLASNNAEPNAASSSPVVTTDGAYVIFASSATNLAGTANSGMQQVFSRWLAQSMTDHRSRGVTGWVSAPAASSDANFVVYSTAARALADDTNDFEDVYAAYGGRGQVEHVSIGASGVQPNGDSSNPSVSANGMLFAFASSASNLVQGDTNGVSDVFVRGLVDKIIARVSVGSGGEQSNGWSASGVLSGDGQRIAFCSDASNLVAGDTNRATDVFVHDLVSHETQRISVSSTGVQGDGSSCRPSLSGDGRLVAFSSFATNLVPDDVAFPGDTNYEDVFVHDMVTGATVRISVAPGGARANGDSTVPVISANGKVVAFISTARNLVLGDSNGWSDAFAFEFTSLFPAARNDP